MGIKTKEGPRRDRASITIEPHLLAWVDAEAERDNVSRSRAIERAIEDQIAARKGKTLAKREGERGAAE
jgi:metal-responsive CopG/Arc/MetJ family transcriptional regulator